MESQYQQNPANIPRNAGNTEDRKTTTGKADRNTSTRKRLQYCQNGVGFGGWHGREQNAPQDVGIHPIALRAVIRQVEVLIALLTRAEDRASAGLAGIGTTPAPGDVAILAPTASEVRQKF